MENFVVVIIGICKYCVVFFFVVNDFCNCYKDGGIEVGIDIECVWDKFRNELFVMEVDDIDVRIDISVFKKVIFIYINYKLIMNIFFSIEIKNKFKVICKGIRVLVF